MTTTENEKPLRVLEWRIEDGIATVVLNCPPENRLTSDVIMSFAEMTAELSGNKKVRAVLFEAVGSDFSFGGDFQSWPEFSDDVMKEMVASGLPMVNTFENIEAPVISLVQGRCLGGGFELVLRTDIIIAAENAIFGHPEAGIGVFTLIGGVQRVAERVGRTRAMQWALTTEDIDARTALETGLINQVVPLEELQSAGRAMAEKLAHGATRSHAAHKKLLRAWSEGGIAAADEKLADLTYEIMQSKDARGAIRLACDAAEAGSPRPKYPFEGK